MKKFSFMKKFIGLLLCFFTVSAGNFCAWSANDTQNANCKKLSFQSSDSEMGMITIYHIGQYPDEPDTTNIEGGWKEFCDSDSLYVVATPKVGYRLSQWSNGDTSNVIVTFGGELERNVRSIPAGDSLKTIAYFETDPSKGHLYVSSDNPKVGMVYGGGNYMDSTVVEAYVKNGICARFTHWSDGETANPRVWNKEGTDTLVAYFEENGTHLIAESADKEQGTVTVQIGSDTVYNHHVVTWSKTTFVTLSAQAKTGYQFIEWNTGDKRPIIYINSGCDTIRYTAYFEPAKDTFCISIYTEDSNMGRTNDYFCGVPGQRIEKFAEPFTGYELDYWESVRGYSTDTIVGNDTLVAHFKKSATSCKRIVFRSDNEEMGTIEVFSLGGIFMDSTHIQPNKIMLCQGDSSYAVATAKKGYKFSHWNNMDTSNVVDTYGGQLEKDIQAMAINDTLNVVAYFEPDTFKGYLVVSSAAPKIGKVYGGGKYMDSTTVRAHVNSGICARFSHWSDGDTNNPRVWNKEGTDTLVAYFEENATHIIFESANEARGSVIAQTGPNAVDNHYIVTWSETQAVTLSAQAKAGYQFTEWNTGDKRPVIYVNSGCDTIRYTAYFEPAKDTFCISICAENSNQGRTNNYFCGVEGQKIEKFEEAKPGYEFDYWESIRGYSTDTIVGNDTLVAHFKKTTTSCKKIVFCSDNEEMGTVEVFSLDGIFMDSTHIQPNKIMLCQGDSSYAVATAKKGYKFSHWNNMDTSNVVDTYGGQLEKDIQTMASDDTLTVVAYFKEIEEIKTNSMEVPLTNNRFCVWTDNLTIHFHSAKKEVEIYDLNGKLVARKAAGDETESITMPQGGIYIVKSGTESIKVEL